MILFDDYKGSVFFLLRQLLWSSYQALQLSHFSCFTVHICFQQFFFSLFISTVVSHNMAFPVNINPLTEPELEAKANETDYLKLS